MNKKEFLSELQSKLCGLPQKDVDEHLSFYSEAIDDRIEDGLSEEEAVFDVGSVDSIVASILSEIPLPKLVKENLKLKKRFKTWEIILLAVGSPIWLSLLMSAIAVCIALYAALWSILISFWAVFASLASASAGGLVSGILFTFKGNYAPGIFTIGAAILTAGLSILAFFGCKAATNGTFLLTKKIILGIKKCFIKKEDRNE